MFKDRSGAPVFPSSRSLVTAAVAFIDRDQTRKLQSGATLPPLFKRG